MLEIDQAWNIDSFELWPWKFLQKGGISKSFDLAGQNKALKDPGQFQNFIFWKSVYRVQPETANSVVFFLFKNKIG